MIAVGANGVWCSNLCRDLRCVGPSDLPGGNGPCARAGADYQERLQRARPTARAMNKVTIGARLCEPQHVGRGTTVETIDRLGEERSCCGSQTSQTRAPTR